MIISEPKGKVVLVLNYYVIKAYWGVKVLFLEYLTRNIMGVNDQLRALVDLPLQETG
jgi:hypothetical protein